MNLLIKTYVHHEMFKGVGLDAAHSLLVQDPEGQFDHLLVVVAVHLSSHHVTKLWELNIAGVVRVKLNRVLKYNIFPPDQTRTSLRISRISFSVGFIPRLLMA